MATVRSLTQYLETIAPLAYQESYDNCGLLVGNPNAEITGVLVTLDCLESTIEEAIDKKCNVIVAHHPIIFKGLKKLTGSHYVERIVIKAIQSNIAIYAIHTNLDNIDKGVNFKLAQKIGLSNCKILDQKTETITKMVTFSPIENAPEIRKALQDAGAGSLGDYIGCSFSVAGTGRFTPTDNADPYIGKPGELTEVKEERIEVIFPTYKRNKIVDALTAAHPYEEVAYYLTTMQNANQEAGAGMIGELENPLTEEDFIQQLKKTFQLQVVRHTAFKGKQIKKVAVCGGAGSFLIAKALREQADVLVTADLKYHEFFEADGKILLADIGHYESEIATTELLLEIIKEKFTTFAVNLTESKTNPVIYT